MSAKFAFAALCRFALSGVAACLLISACGGGGAGTGTNTDPDSKLLISAGMIPASLDDSYRFLTQASFGPTADQVTRVNKIGYDNWIDEQLNMHLQTTHLQMVEQSAASLSMVAPNPWNVNYSWWTHAIKDPAQLRQRVAFALSEIFVVSTMTVDSGRAVASYLDMLTDKADGNFRDLLEAVAMHPAMGQYLSHLANRKEDPSTGRVPDENFAREVMQLFSIGLYELDDSGNPKMVNGAPVETYNADDIKGMAKVFTGFSWNWPTAKSAVEWWHCFWRTAMCQIDSQDVTPMTGYAILHSISIKQFLGVTIPAQSIASPSTSFRIALDRLASHPNTAPFISKQLIQRLVTSNPSNQYVSDITQVFRSTQGNLHAVVKAILLHNEARQPDAATMNTYGKLREPILRLTHLMRALPHSSGNYARMATNGSMPFYLMSDTSDPSTGVGQAPMRSPSVFNFFRPGYKAPQTQMSAVDKVVPEMQIMSETSVLSYANSVAQMLEQGMGQWNNQTAAFDIHFDLSQWYGLVSTPGDLLDTVSRTLLGHVLPTDARAEAIASIAAMPASNAYERTHCVQAAVLLVGVSPSFIVQQ
jgi:uncharacterized protein (DUF1800 family)